jgi:DNA-binding LacI/PurR family transcriptional regulator
VASRARPGSRRRPTMRDVASRAGVSIQTVSNFVNRRFHLMTRETRSRVDRAMQELGYHPNVAARSLRSAKTDTLGFLVLDQDARFLADPMTDLIIAGIGDVLRDRGYGLLIQAARPDGPKPVLLQPLLENRVGGAFLFLSGEPELRSWYVNRSIELGFDFVLFERHDNARVASVTAADRKGARELTEHLLARGHRRIAFIAAAIPWPMIEERREGYREALVAAGINPDPALEVADGVWDPASGAAMARLLLELDRAPTAIMCGNDLLAIGAIRAVRQRALRVPEDVAVTGFDDFDFADFVDPPLTTVRIPGYEMGHDAAQWLVDRLEGGAAREPRVELPVELCLRESG